MPARAQRIVVAAAFAQERDAHYASRLLSTSPDIDVRYRLRRVTDEQGEVQMVVLEASVTDPAHVSRVETAMMGGHGVIVTAEALTRAARAS